MGRLVGVVVVGAGFKPFFFLFLERERERFIYFGDTISNNSPITIYYNLIRVNAQR